nr:multiple organellar RNA editing factor 8, chloroplastic/mitochondrial-like [Lolium perenne]
MPTVELQMDCYGCAKNISKALKKVAGVEDVWWSSSEQKVWVQGTASAQELKTRLEIKLRRPVSILSHRVIDPPAPSRRAPSPPPPTPPAPSRRAPSPPPPTRQAPSRRAPSPPPPTRAPPMSPPRYRPPTSPPNYPPPPPPQSGYGYYEQYGGNGYYEQYGGNGYYDQYGGNGSHYDQYGGSNYDQYGGNGNYYDQYRGNSTANLYNNYVNYVGHPQGPHYVPNDAPDTFSDENPNACSIQ